MRSIGSKPIDLKPIDLKHGSASTWAALALCALFGVVGAWRVSMASSMGWDEAMHTELPALRISLALREGDLAGAADAVLDCDRYPFVWPAVLAAVQLVTGPSELAARAAGRVLWGIGCFGLFLLGRELVRRGRLARAPSGSARATPEPVRGDELVPWLCLALGAASPLALAYSGMLFQEAPFLVVSVFALRAWLRRREAPEGLERRRELAAGAWLALGFFTRFPNGLLLGAALALDLALEAVLELRAGRKAAFARRSAWLALIPLVAGAWWFALPLPGGLDVAARHRAEFWDFVRGNRDASMATSWNERWIHWACFFAFTPRVLALQALGMLRALAEPRRSGARTLWLVFLVVGLAVCTHPFHLARFLLPFGAVVWPLAALGIARAVPRAPAARAATLAGLALAVALAPSWDGRLVLAGTVGLEEHREYKEERVREMRSLAPGRGLETNGLRRAESEALLELVARALGPDEDVAQVGVSTRFSPAALQLGLLRRGGSVARARRGLEAHGFLTVAHVDPGFPDEQLFAWARQFDVLLATEPPDIGGDRRREFTRAYRDRLAANPEWETVGLGRLDVSNAVGVVSSVSVYALRPAAERGE